jgi:hypothetical protein
MRTLGNAVVVALALFANGAAAWDWDAVFATKAKPTMVFARSRKEINAFAVRPWWFTVHETVHESLLVTCYGRE